MKKIILSLASFFCISAHFAFAQVTYHPDKPPQANEKALDQKVLDCASDAKILGNQFSFSEWTAEIHFYSRKLLQRLSSEHVSPLAAVKEQVAYLYQLSESCEALQPAQNELKSLHKIYEEEITYEKATSSGGLFDDEEIEASMDTKDAENVVKYIEKLRKKLDISREIIRIQ